MDFPARITSWFYTCKLHTTDHHCGKYQGEAFDPEEPVKDEEQHLHLFDSDHLNVHTDHRLKDTEDQMCGDDSVSLRS